VWLVMGPSRPTGEDAKVENALLTSGPYTVSETHHVSGMTLFLLERKS
jgi:hypothetical protein